MISVLTPVRNRPVWLAETLDSLIAQTLPDWECLILDDASTDETPAVAESYCRRDARFRLIRLEKRRNIAHVQNAARGMTRGEFIATQDSDDVAFPERFEKQLAFMTAHPGIAAVGAWTEDIDADGRPAGFLRTPVEERELKITARFMNPIANPTAFMRTSALDAIGWFDDSYLLAFDAKVWSDFLRLGFRLANLPECLVKRRVHAAQNSLRNDQAPIWARKAYASMVGEPLDGWEARCLSALKADLARVLATACLVWGTGLCGRQLLKISREIGISVDSFVDSRPTTPQIEGIPVYGPERVAATRLPVAVASATGWHEIFPMLDGRDHICVHRIVGRIVSFERDRGGSRALY